MRKTKHLVLAAVVAGFGLGFAQAEAAQPRLRPLQMRVMHKQNLVAIQPLKMRFASPLVQRKMGPIGQSIQQSLRDLRESMGLPPEGLIAALISGDLSPFEGIGNYFESWGENFANEFEHEFEQAAQREAEHQAREQWNQWGEDVTQGLEDAGNEVSDFFDHVF